MKRDINKAFDRELKKELKRWRRVWFLLALASVLVLLAYTPIFTETVTGAITGVEEWDRGGTSNLRINVKLKSGREATVIAQTGVLIICRLDTQVERVGVQL